MRVSPAHFFSLVVLAAFVGPAAMQGAQATFHLPIPAHWGQVVLAPGDYKLLAPNLSVGQPMFRIDGEGKSAFALPKVTDNSEHYSKSSYLTLSEIDGSYYVKEFSSGATGKTFTFATPSDHRRQDIAKGQGNSFVLSVR